VEAPLIKKPKEEVKGGIRVLNISSSEEEEEEAEVEAPPNLETRPRVFSNSDMDVEEVKIAPPSRRSKVPHRPPMLGSRQSDEWFCYTQDAATTQFEEMTIAYLWKVAEAREHRPAVLERASQLGLGRRASRKLISFLNGGAKLTVSEYRRIMDVAQSRKSGWSSHGFMEIDDAELINRIVEAKSRGEDYILQMLRDEGGIRALPRLPLAAPHKNTHPTCEAKLWRIQASINSLM
jgi:hypothetical protein